MPLIKKQTFFLRKAFPLERKNRPNTCAFIKQHVKHRKRTLKQQQSRPATWKLPVANVVHTIPEGKWLPRPTKERARDPQPATGHDQTLHKPQELSGQHPVQSQELPPPHPAEPQGSHTALGTQNQEGEHDLPSVQDFHPAPACPGLLTACSRQPASRARSKVVVAALGPPPPHGRCSALTRSGWTRSLPLLADRLAREGEYRFPPQHWSAAPRGPGRPSLFFMSDSFVQHRNVNSIPSAASICRAEARFADYILPPTPRVSALPSARGAQLSLRWPTQPVHGAVWHTAGTALQN